MHFGLNGSNQNATIKNFNKPGFTLTEMLIALTVLGIMATFIIPKLLNNSQHTRWNALAKESGSMFTEALLQYRQTQPVDAYTSGADIIAGINAIKRETTINVDGVPNNPGFPTYDCSNSSIYCYRLPNGALVTTDNQGFGENDLPGYAANPNQFLVWLLIDPDGKETGNADSLAFWMYPNGKLKTWGAIDANSKDGYGNTLNPEPTKDPSWFNW